MLPVALSLVALFLLSSAFVVYVLFGYPLLLGLVSRWRCRPVRTSPQERTVSVLLPVYNGEPWIRGKLRSILELDYSRALLQVIVISDGSTDRTEELARDFVAEGIELIALPRGGKARALNAGMQQARGEILFFTDVRQRLDPGSLRQLVDCFADPAVGVVSGELIILKGESQEEANVGLYWHYEKWIRKRLSRLDSVIGATGCIYAMRRELAVPLPPDTLVDDVHLPLAAFFRGYRVILETGARAYDYPTSLGSEFRRKVRTLAGNYQVMLAFPALLGPRNRMWIHFMSHKAARLLLPHAMILAAIGSFGLPSPWLGWVIAGQAAFYGLAALDVWIPQTWLLKRLSSPVRTFVVLLAATFCAMSFFFSGGKNLWKETQVAKAVR